MLRCARLALPFPLENFERFAAGVGAEDKSQATRSGNMNQKNLEGTLVLRAQLTGSMRKTQPEEALGCSMADEKSWKNKNLPHMLWLCNQRHANIHTLTPPHRSGTTSTPGLPRF
jgi:hypothetical protein